MRRGRAGHGGGPRMQCMLVHARCSSESSGELHGAGGNCCAAGGSGAGTHSFAVGDAGNPLLLGCDMTPVEPHGDAGSGHAAVPEVQRRVRGLAARDRRRRAILNPLGYKRRWKWNSFVIRPALIQLPQPCRWYMRPSLELLHASAAPSTLLSAAGGPPHDLASQCGPQHSSARTN